MKNNKEMARKTKVEKRRLAFEKRNVKKELNLARYGAEGGSALIIAKSADFNRRFVAAFLALVFAISTMVLGLNFATKAEDTQQTQVVTKGVSSNLVVDKTISLANDNTYTLTLSAYAKGAIKNVTTQIPTDYVLVVDQSGSMKTEDMPTDYVEATMPSGGWTFDDFENGTDYDGNAIDKELYVKVGDKYYRVYRKWGQLYEKVPRNTVYCKDIVDSRNLRWFADEKGTESDFNSQYYYQPSSDVNITRECAGGDYIQPGGEDDDNFYPLTISSQGRTFYYSIRLNYYDSTGTRRYLRYTNNSTDSTANKDLETGACIWYRNPSGGYFGPGAYYVVSYTFANDLVVGWINGNTNWDSFYTYGQITSAVQSGMYIQNTMYIGHVGYNSLAYRDSDGEEHIISHTDFCDAYDNPTNDREGTISFSDDSLTLYEPTGTKLTRLQAVQNALNEFVSTVASQQDDNGYVDHRIALVGFSSDGYNNNELLTNTTEGFSVDHTASWTNESGSAHYSLNGYAHDGIQKATADSITSYYAKALVTAHTNDADGITDSILDGIQGLTAHGGTKPGTGLEMAYNILNLNDKNSEYASGDRNAVVIFFTDGRPGNYSNVNQYTEANTVVSKANTIKSNISGVQIYSVGVFGEADGNPLTYVDGSAGPYYYYGDVENLYDSLYCSSRGSNKHTTENNEKVSSQTNISDASIPSGYTYWPAQIEETYYPDYAKTVSSFYRNITVSWSWTTGGIIGIGSTSHSASGTVPTYNLAFYWRDCMRNTTNYPKTENDTIFDYMTVVSSSYPSATSFDNGWSHLSRENKRVGNYNSSISSVRRDKGPGRYYMSASDSANLNEIFVNIASEATTSTIPDTADLFLQDVISDNFDLPANPESHVTARSYVGTQAVANGAISFSDTPTTDHFETNWINKKLVVSGFSFSENYIMNGKPANNNQGTKESQGKKLEVTITGLTPSDGKTGDALKSNVETADSDSGISGIMENDDGSITCIEPFISPSITRHSYTIKKGQGVQEAAVNFTIVDENRNPIDPSELTDVVIQSDRRYAYDPDKLTNISGSADGTVIYLENLPAGAQVKSVVTYEEEPGYDANIAVMQESNPVNPTGATDPTYITPYADGDVLINVNAVANEKVVTITETVGGSYYSDDDTFTPVLTLIPPSASAYTDSTKVVTGSKAGIAESFTFNRDSTTGNYNLSIASVGIGDGNKLVFNIPYGWTLKVEQTDSGYYIPTPTITYGDQATPAVPAGTEYPTSGKEILVNTDIVINNVADNITIEGVTDSNNHNWIIYILAAVVGLAAIGAGIFLWKKRNEFVEE